MKIRCLDLNRVMGLLYHVSPASLKSLLTIVKLRLIQRQAPYRRENPCKSTLATIAG